LACGLVRTARCICEPHAAEADRRANSDRTRLWQIFCLVSDGDDLAAAQSIAPDPSHTPTATVAIISSPTESAGYS
jgi:hypothetical protein